MFGSEGVLEDLKLEVKGLCGRYGTRSVFAGVEFSLRPGDCLVVVGANGAGKSTLLRILCGLTRPYRGQVCLQVENTPCVFGPQQGEAERLGRYTGLASPEIQLYGELSAAENLAFFARVRGLNMDRDQTLALLERAGLRDRADNRVSAFSSGMRQRLRLLFALQHGPPVLLLDEPGSNLDEPGRALVAEIVEEQLHRGIVILATNDPEEMCFGEQVLKLG